MELSNWERLQRRIHAMHGLWSKSIQDLSTDQINRKERDGVVPIAFSLLHYVCGEDRNVSLYLLEEPAVWESGYWGDKVGGNQVEVRRGTPVELAETATIGDADTWRNYQSAVFERTESAMAAQTPDRYEHQLFETMPDQLRPTFVGLLIASGEPVALGDLLDGFVYQHGIRHLGEIDHARSLLGLTGVS